jgi:hypothetical protein
MFCRVYCKVQNSFGHRGWAHSAHRALTKTHRGSWRATELDRDRQSKVGLSGKAWKSYLCVYSNTPACSRDNYRIWSSYIHHTLSHFLPAHCCFSAAVLEQEWLYYALLSESFSRISWCISKPWSPALVAYPWICIWGTGTRMAWRTQHISAQKATKRYSRYFKMIQDIWGLCFNYCKSFEAGHLHELLNRIFWPGLGPWNHACRPQAMLALQGVTHWTASPEPCPPKALFSRSSAEPLTGLRSSPESRMCKQDWTWLNNNHQ